MVMELIFRSIFWIGVGSLVFSLFINFDPYFPYFALVFGSGAVMIVYSLYEQFLLKKASQQPQQPVSAPVGQPQPRPAVSQQLTAYRLPSSQPSSQQFSSLEQYRPLAFFNRFFHHPQQHPPVQQQQSPSSEAHRGTFFTRLFHHPSRSQQQSKQQLPLATLDNVKHLFEEDISLQRQQQPATFQQPPTQAQQPISFQRSPPAQQRPPQSQPAAPSQQPEFPFEEGLEHYIPTGAEQLPHDHWNRYADNREIIASPTDHRYQPLQPAQQPSSPLQRSQQPASQATATQQPPTAYHLHLSPHYKDRQHEKLLFIILLVVGLVLMSASLFVPLKDYLLIIMILFFLGLLLLSASLAELYHLKKRHPLPLTSSATQPFSSLPMSLGQQQTTLKPVSKQMTPPAQPSMPIQQPPSKQFQQPLPQPASSSAPVDTEQLTTLVPYVKQSLRQHIPLETIRAAAQKSGWPNTLIDQAFAATSKLTSKKKKAIALLGLVIVLVVLLVTLNSQDLFLLPYWVELLGDASPQFYIVMSVVFLLIILLFARKAHILYKGKRIQYHVAEEQSIAAIKEELQHAPTVIRGTYETDFDRLYHLLQERKKLTVTEVSQGFTVSRKEAEEWGNILKEQGLIELHYPAVGDLELRWKK